MVSATQRKPSRREQLEAERLLTCPEVDFLYRLKEGTAREAAAAGLVPSSERPWGTRKTYLISRQDAAEQWGPR